MREEFEKEKADWFPVTSPPDLASYQKRTPGLFKEEFRGTEMIFLNAKTYVECTMLKPTRPSSAARELRRSL